jgi:hypothetical protein
MIQTLNRVRGMLLQFRVSAVANRELVDRTLTELDDIEAVIAEEIEETITEDEVGDVKPILVPVLVPEGE